jgi:ribonuclease J
VEITALGGLGEFGKNCLVVRAGGQAVILDAGISFPDESLPGVDRVAPDFSGLSGEDVRGIFLTHGHEDHIGALGQLLETVDAPVFCTAFTAALARRRMAESGVRGRFHPTVPGAPVRAGAFSLTFLPVSHSVPQSAALVVEVEGMRLFHSGDFKLDSDGPERERTDLSEWARLAAGCDLAMIDSTNAERAGRCGSEREARAGVGEEIRRSAGRVVLTTFSSHVARISGAVESARAAGRRVALLGKSMREIADLAEEFGYLSLPAGIRLERSEIAGSPARRLLAVCAGSQGEPYSALFRLALDRHADLRLSPGDRVIFSARSIPGRQQAVARVIDHLLRRGASVVEPDAGSPIHVSGHAWRDDLREAIQALRPRAVLPLHGHRKALARCGEVAVEAGVAPERVFLCDNGDSLFLDPDGCRLAPGEREARAVFLDAAGGAEIEGDRVQERRLLGSEGLVVVLAAMTARGPARIEVVTRGLAADSADVAQDVERAVLDALRAGSAEEHRDPEWARTEISDAVKRVCRRRYGSRPMIVPIVAES